MPVRIKFKPLHRQVIVITGATSGSGLAAAQMAVDHGAAVVLAARIQPALEEVAAALRAKGGRVAFCAADVAQDADVERIAQVAIESFGGFDTWVNNAAAATYGTIEQVSLEDHRRTFHVN